MLKKQNWFITIPVVLLSIYWVFTSVYTAKDRTLKGMEPYKHALQIALSSPEVTQKLGTPIEEGFLPKGVFSVNGDNGEANLTVQLIGPLSEGELQFDAIRKEKRWSYNQIVFRDQNGNSLNLIQ